jgi:hypothetical protein
MQSSYADSPFRDIACFRGHALSRVRSVHPRRGGLVLSRSRANAMNARSFGNA